MRERERERETKENREVQKDPERGEEINLEK